MKNAYSCSRIRGEWRPFRSNALLELRRDGTCNEQQRPNGVNNLLMFMYQVLCKSVVPNAQIRKSDRENKMGAWDGYDDIISTEE